MRLSCEHLHQPDGWLSPGILTIDDAGTIITVEAGAPTEDDVRISGYTLPGMANVHSHAFQRALAGFVQLADDREDSFWTWRTGMYRLALSLTPDELRAIAAQLYVEMLEAGYTAVGEFQYLHHQPGGEPYHNPAELSDALIDAARTAGMPLTLLPVAYFTGGFDRPALLEQRRFVHRDPQAFLTTWEAARASLRSHRFGVIGVAPHSLRAVPEAALAELLSAIETTEPEAPKHIHIAEQPQEVQDCQRYHGKRPIQWLAGRFGLGPAWCLVHATHATDDELAAIADSNAVVGLCPTTEADLGDGVFRAEAFRRLAGRWAIGSDSHATVSVSRELALLEWGQRLVLGRRNVLWGAERQVGRSLYDTASATGADAIAQNTGALAPGRRADLVVLDADHPRLIGHDPATAVDAWVFSGADDVIRDVWVGGTQLVANGRHSRQEAVRRDFVAAMSSLRARWR